MCLAIPGKLISISRNDPLMVTGIVDFSGVRKEVNLAFITDVAIGEFVIVHAGFALNKIDEIEARKTLRYLDQISQSSDSEDSRQ